MQWIILFLFFSSSNATNITIATSYHPKGHQRAKAVGFHTSIEENISSFYDLGIEFSYSYSKKSEILNRYEKKFKAFILKPYIKFFYRLENYTPYCRVGLHLGKAKFEDTNSKRYIDKSSIGHFLSVGVMKKYLVSPYLEFEYRDFYGAFNNFNDSSLKVGGSYNF